MYEGKFQAASLIFSFPYRAYVYLIGQNFRHLWYILSLLSNIFSCFVAQNIRPRKSFFGKKVSSLLSDVLKYKPNLRTSVNYRIAFTRKHTKLHNTQNFNNILLSSWKNEEDINSLSVHLSSWINFHSRSVLFMFILSRRSRKLDITQTKH